MRVTHVKRSAVDGERRMTDGKATAAVSAHGRHVSPTENGVCRAPQLRMTRMRSDLRKTIGLLLQRRLVADSLAP